MRFSLHMSQDDAEKMARRIRTALESPDTEAGSRAKAELLALAADLGHGAAFASDNPQVN